MTHATPPAGEDPAAGAPQKTPSASDAPEVEAHAMPVLDAQGLPQQAGQDAETGFCPSLFSLVLPD
jgi:hypothetical protein